MPRVYGDVNSGNCYKVKLLLRQLDMPFEWIHIDILAKASRTPQFLALNPSGQIPVLVQDDGVVLTESNAILHYLAEGSTLLPLERMARAQVLRWMFWEQYTHEPSVASARYIVRYLGRPAEHEPVLQRRIADGHAALAILEQHLATRAFLVGDRYSIADIALYAYTHVAEEGLIDLAAYRAVRAWLARVRAEPGHVTMQE